MKRNAGFVLALIVGSVVSCRKPETKADHGEGDRPSEPHPVTIVFRGSDTLGARLLPELAEEYIKSNPHVSFEIAAEGGRPPGIDGVARSLLDGQVIMTTRQVRDDQRERLEARLRELSEGDQTKRLSD